MKSANDMRSMFDKAASIFNKKCAEKMLSDIDAVLNTAYEVMESSGIPTRSVSCDVGGNPDAAIKIVMKELENSGYSVQRSESRGYPISLNISWI